MKVFGVLVLVLVAIATVNAEYTFVSSQEPAEAVVVEADVVGAAIAFENRDDAK